MVRDAAEVEAAICCCMLPGEANATKALHVTKSLMCSMRHTWNHWYLSTGTVFESEDTQAKAGHWNYSWPNKRNKRTNVPRTALIPSICIRTEAAISESKNRRSIQLSQLPTAGPGEGRNKGFGLFQHTTCQGVKVMQKHTASQNSFHLTHCDALALFQYRLTVGGWQLTGTAQQAINQPAMLFSCTNKWNIDIGTSGTRRLIVHSYSCHQDQFNIQ